jgi:hypothetical protein
MKDCSTEEPFGYENTARLASRAQAVLLKLKMIVNFGVATGLGFIPRPGSAGTIASEFLVPAVSFRRETRESTSVLSRL